MAYPPKWPPKPMKLGPWNPDVGAFVIENFWEEERFYKFHSNQLDLRTEEVKVQHAAEEEQRQQKKKKEEEELEEEMKTWGDQDWSHEVGLIYERVEVDQGPAVRRRDKAQAFYQKLYNKLKKSKKGRWILKYVLKLKVAEPKDPDRTLKRWLKFMDQSVIDEWKDYQPRYYRDVYKSDRPFDHFNEPGVHMRRPNGPAIPEDIILTRIKEEEKERKEEEVREKEFAREKEQKEEEEELRKYMEEQAGSQSGHYISTPEKETFFTSPYSRVDSEMMMGNIPLSPLSSTSSNSHPSSPEQFSIEPSLGKLSTLQP